MASSEELIRCLKMHPHGNSGLEVNAVASRPEVSCYVRTRTRGSSRRSGLAGYAGAISEL